MRYRPRTDANQKEIVKALRAIGANVLSLAGIGKGCPDLLVQFRDELHLLEIKDGRKSPSRRRLTRDEAVFTAAWKTKVVEDVDQAFKAIGVRL